MLRETRLSGQLLSLFAAGIASPAIAQDATLFDGATVATVVHAPERPLTLAATMLAGDLRELSGLAPPVSDTLADCRAVCVVVGTTGSPLIEAVRRDTGLSRTDLTGQWERYARVLVRSRTDPSRQYLVVEGSDVRGAIWGVVDLTRELGVSPWEWWADVAPRRAPRLVVSGRAIVSRAPSVKYRGIFLNDEDWGLQPWAAKTFEPEVGDIGPRTYSRIFELMWRLKANLIWPAMHDSTRPFYQIAGNAKAASDHAIVVGTSHAEPMMRNNVREWDERARGDFNFFTNRDAIVDYWRTRAQEVKGFENVYTIGLRGKHDSAMEGADTPEKARDALTQVFAIQRDLLSRAQARPASAVPQALTLYKEVLDVYRTGLDVPDDVTLVWPEDNYGYINQLSTPGERKRSGGSGVYYHISYWGRPHDYLWLATTHPALIREQMDRAWQTEARRIWVLNVGDIKPGEYLTQYFLDLAFDDRQLEPSARAHLARWAVATFGPAVADEVAAILTGYYDLAFERRPEFMGFSQVEPVTPVRIGDHVRSGGAEASQRIDRYVALRARAEALAPRLPADRRDAFFQLVLYPVRGAANLNERNLKLDLAALYARQGRPVANVLAAEAKAAHARIVADTATYNAQNGGKWRGIMDMAPRGLPVFAEPVYPIATVPPRPGCTVDASELTFVSGRAATHALTIHGRGVSADWRWTGFAGITPETDRGRIEPRNGFHQRIPVAYDGRTVPAFGTATCGGKPFAVVARFVTPSTPDGPVEIERTIALTQPSGTTLSRDWERIDGLGSQGSALRSRLSLPSRDRPAGEPLTYAFDLAATGDATLHVVALPVHPLTSADRLRIAVQVDDGAAQMLDFETHGRSDEWKANVLSNSARRTLRLPQIARGAHRIRVHALDPGFVLDRVELRLDGAPDRYGAAPTR